MAPCFLGNASGFQPIQPTVSSYFGAHAQRHPNATMRNAPLPPEGRPRSPVAQRPGDFSRRPQATHQFVMRDGLALLRPIGRQPRIQDFSVTSGYRHLFFVRYREPQAFRRFEPFALGQSACRLLHLKDANAAKLARRLGTSSARFRDRNTHCFLRFHRSNSTAASRMRPRATYW